MAREMRSLEAAFDAERALVFGIGGSGDVVSAIPTARLLSDHGVETILGGIAWEIAPNDPIPGPRSFEEIDHLERVSRTVGLAGPETRTEEGVEFAETGVARATGERVALLDVSRGRRAFVDGLVAGCEELDVDLVVGVDAGGDVLAAGDEPGLRSPIADGLGIVALSSIPQTGLLGVLGYGSDGELRLEELEAAFARIAGDDGLLGAWGITPDARNVLETVLEEVSTEASRLPVEASKGGFGRRRIRDGTVEVRLTPPSVVTFYFDPVVVAAASSIASIVRGADDLGAIRRAFADAGIQTEFESEERRLDRHRRG